MDPREEVREDGERGGGGGGGERAGLGPDVLPVGEERLGEDRRRGVHGKGGGSQQLPCQCLLSTSCSDCSSTPINHTCTNYDE